MLSMIIWVFAITGSLSVVSLAVAFNAQMLHLVATAVVSLSIMAMAISEHRSADLAGQSESHLAAVASRYIGILWAWSAVSAYVVYGFLLAWPLWLGAVIGMSLLSVVFLFVAFILDREALSSGPDASISALLHLLTKAQFVIGTVLFGTMVALRSHPALTLGGAEAWVAVNLFLCSAAALMTLTGYLIMQLKPRTAPVAVSDLSLRPQ